MASLSSPLRVCRGILKELRAIQGASYKQSLAYNYVMDQFRKNKKEAELQIYQDIAVHLNRRVQVEEGALVTGERYCRAQQEAHHASLTYLCLLGSTRNHLALHTLYHSKGERSPEQVAGLVGLRLPSQPGGKGWEE